MPIVVIRSDNSICSRFTQERNDALPIVVTLSGSVICVSPLQPLNALSPIERMLCGIVISLRLVQPANISCATVVSEAGMFTSSSRMQFLKMPLPRDTMLSGSSMLLRLVHCENA